MRQRAVVIDDDKHCRRLLALILEQNGYEVVSLAEPTACPVYAEPQARCSHQQACGDFLLTDNRMPVMSGLRFIETLLQRGCKGVARNMAVLSAGWTEAEKAHAERLGCTIFTKPYDLQTVLDWLQQRGELIPADRQLMPLAPVTGMVTEGTSGE